jgi:AbrB family looped-hinge helix DNA binding protein
METVTVSSKGQIAIPRQVRDSLNLAPGAKLTLEVRGHEIVLSKDAAWKLLRGAVADPALMDKFSEFRRVEREREDADS